MVTSPASSMTREMQVVGQSALKPEGGHPPKKQECPSLEPVLLGLTVLGCRRGPDNAF